MLYQAVRPNSLDEIVGNSDTVGALRRMLRSNTKSHSYMLSGPYGVGKTTIARIMAKEFGSTQFSTIEYNVANTRGIDTIRSIVSDLKRSTIDGSPRTFIFDESQQSTREAQEALLKPIEDVSDDVYFIFCTTSPESILKGIRTRCTEYSLSLLSDTELLDVINRACEKMDLGVKDEIKQAIACASDGCPRKALVALEQVSDETDLEAAVRLVVKGSDKDTTVFELSKMLLRVPDKRKRDWKKILDTFYSIESDPEILRRSLLTLFLNKMRCCGRLEDAEDIAFLIECFTTSVYYGGKGQLAAQVVRACFQTNVRR